MKYILVFLAALSFSACATLHQPDGSLNLEVILNDAQWGVVEACSVEWLPPDACTFTLDALTTARDILAKNLSSAEADVRKSLVDAEAKVPADSRVRPYLDAIIALLPAV